MSVRGWLRGGRAQFLRFWGIVAALLLLIGLPCGYINQGDGVQRYHQTLAVLFDGTTALTHARSDGRTRDLPASEVLIPGADGRHYSRFAVGLSVVWLVPVLIAHFLSESFGLPFDLLAQFLISFVNPLVVLCTTGVLFRFARQWGSTPKESAFVVAMYLCGSSALPYANTGFAEPLCGLLLVIITGMLFSPGNPTVRAVLWAGALTAVLCAVKLELVLTGVVSGAVLFLQRRWKTSLVYLPIAATGGLGVLLANKLWRGGWLSFSYGGDSSQFDLRFSGLSDFFLSLDKNLLLFNPVLLVAMFAGVRAVKRSETKGLICFISGSWLVYLLFYGAWNWAGGGWSYGPRFFQPFVPMTCLLLPHLFARSLHEMPVSVGDVKRWRFVARTVVIISLLACLMFQIPGVSVKDNQAIMISDATGRSQWVVQVRLLFLKFVRGPAAPEVYHISDFRDLAAGEGDREIDHRAFRTFQWFNHWWSLAVSNRIRQGAMTGEGQTLP